MPTTAPRTKSWNVLVSYHIGLQEPIVRSFLRSPGAGPAIADMVDLSQSSTMGTIDYNDIFTCSNGIHPANLSMAIVNGKWTEMYLRMRLRVKTVPEVLRSSGSLNSICQQYILRMLSRPWAQRNRTI
jgi:hypothetical protein